MPTPQQRKEFEQRGFLRISAAFSQDAASAMEDKVWEALGRQCGVRRSAPETWAGVQPTGLQHLKEDPVFEAIGSPATMEAVDGLLGAGGWKRPRHWGQFLVTFPSGASDWKVPSESWHTDFGFLTPPDHVRPLSLQLSCPSRPPLGRHCRFGGVSSAGAALRRRYRTEGPHQQGKGSPGNGASGGSIWTRSSATACARCS